MTVAIRTVEQYWDWWKGTNRANTPGFDTQVRVLAPQGRPRVFLTPEACEHQVVQRMVRAGNLMYGMEDGTLQVAPLRWVSSSDLRERARQAEADLREYQRTIAEYLRRQQRLEQDRLRLLEQASRADRSSPRVWPVLREVEQWDEVMAVGAWPESPVRPLNEDYLEMYRPYVWVRFLPVVIPRPNEPSLLSLTMPFDLVLCLRTTSFRSTRCSHHPHAGQNICWGDAPNGESLESQVLRWREDGDIFMLLEAVRQWRYGITSSTLDAVYSPRSWTAMLHAVGRHELLEQRVVDGRTGEVSTLGEVYGVRDSLRAYLAGRTFCWVEEGSDIGARLEKEYLRKSPILQGRVRRWWAWEYGPGYGQETRPGFDATYRVGREGDLLFITEGDMVTLRDNIMATFVDRGGDVLMTGAYDDEDEEESEPCDCRDCRQARHEEGDCGGIDTCDFCQAEEEERHMVHADGDCGGRGSCSYCDDEYYDHSRGYCDGPGDCRYCDEEAAEADEDEEEEQEPAGELTRPPTEAPTLLGSIVDELLETVQQEIREGVE